MIYRGRAEAAFVSTQRALRFLLDGLGRVVVPRVSTPKIGRSENGINPNYPSWSPPLLARDGDAMQRVMIIGQPGAGKSTLAREIGAITHLPVVHIDHIHWRAGWIERTAEEKDALCAEAHARERWVFEGGRSSTWPERLARADTLIWIDVAWPRRVSRVVWRTLRYHGRHRPDLPIGCPERFNAEFFGFIWRTRHTGRERARETYDSAPTDTVKVRLGGPRTVRRYLDGLERAARSGNLGISHR